MIREWRGRDYLWCAAATLLAALQVTVTHSLAAYGSSDRALDALAYFILVAGPMALLSARRYPIAPLLIVTPLVLLYGARDYWIGPVGLAYGIALVLAGAQRHKWYARVSAVVVISFMILALLSGVGTEMAAAPVIGISAWITVAVIGGEQIRARRDAITARRAATDAEARRVLSEERLQLARDLHDVLAHSLSVINVQSAVALHVMDDAPEQVRPALEVIKATSKETLEEVRATLATLRGREHQTAQPVGKIADATALDSMAAAAGLQATVSVTGVKTGLPVAVDVAAYRIAQEAITNVAKHSAAKEVEVGIDYGDAELRLTITDPGPSHHAGPPAIGGHGLQGMKERAADLGGDVDAGRRGSGFRVQASLPFALASGAEV